MSSSLGFELHALEVVAAVCELNSMTLAARQLGMTQPAVSYTIRQLETALGITILDRTRRPLTPTTAGYWLAQAAGRVLREAQQIPLAVRHLETGMAVQLRIGLVDSLSVPFVPQLVRATESSIRFLSISSGLARSLRAGLMDHNLDLLITNDGMEGIDGLLRHPILTEPYVLVVPQKGEWETMSLAELGQRLPLIRWNARSHIAADIERHLRRLRLELPRRLEFESAGVILAMVEAGLGWSLLTPLSIFEVKARMPRIRTLPVPGPAFSRHLDLISRAGEIDVLAGRIAEVAQRILRNRYLPEILRLAPWLDSQVLVGGADRQVPVGGADRQVLFGGADRPPPARRGR